MFVASRTACVCDIKKSLCPWLRKQSLFVTSKTVCVYEVKNNLCLWRQEQGRHIWQKCQLRREPIVSLSFGGKEWTCEDVTRGASANACKIGLLLHKYLQQKNQVCKWNYMRIFSVFRPANVLLCVPFNILTSHGVRFNMLTSHDVPFNILASYGAPCNILASLAVPFNILT